MVELGFIQWKKYEPVATGVLTSDSQPTTSVPDHFMKPCTLPQIFAPVFESCSLGCNWYQYHQSLSLKGERHQVSSLLPSFIHVEHDQCAVYLSRWSTCSRSSRQAVTETLPYPRTKVCTALTQSICTSKTLLALLSSPHLTKSETVRSVQKLGGWLVGWKRDFVFGTVKRVDAKSSGRWPSHACQWISNQVKVLGNNMKAPSVLARSLGAKTSPSNAWLLVSFTDRRATHEW